MDNYINELLEYSKCYDTNALTEINGVLFPEDAALFFKNKINGLNDFIWFITPYDQKWEEMVQEQRNIYQNSKKEFVQDSEKYGYDLKDGEGYPFDFFPDENGLIPWAVCDNYSSFFWKPTKGKITIVVYGECCDYYEYDMTTAEFLYKLINNEIHEMEEFLPDDLFYNGVYWIE